MASEISTLRRSEARLKSDLTFGEERISELQREVGLLRSRLSGLEAGAHEQQILSDVRQAVATKAAAKAPSDAGGSAGAGVGGVQQWLGSYLLGKAHPQFISEAQSMADSVSVHPGHTFLPQFDVQHRDSVLWDRASLS